VSVNRTPSRAHHPEILESPAKKRFKRRTRCQRDAGRAALLAAMPKAEGNRRFGRPRIGGSVKEPPKSGERPIFCDPIKAPPTLSDLGIAEKQSSELNRSDSCLRE
jgi:hypothetical protein